MTSVNQPLTAFPDDTAPRQVPCHFAKRMLNWLLWHRHENLRLLQVSVSRPMVGLVLHPEGDLIAAAGRSSAQLVRRDRE